MKKHNRKRLWLAGLLLWLGVVTFGLSGTATASAQELPAKVVLENFPVFGQWYNLSCEYSSTRMITAYWKKEINDTQFLEAIPFDDNPHIGFRGAINGWFGGTWNYGIYAEPIARVLEQRGFETKLLAGGVESLKNELALGRPVQVWAIAGMGWGNPFTAEAAGLPFSLAGGEHSLVAYGYDANGIYIADPAYGGRDYYDWPTFIRSWSYFDYMAMSVWPTDDKPEASPGVSQYFYRHWLNGGGMTQFGMPLGEAYTENGKVYQYFERVRMEFDLSGNYTQPIKIGLLGTELSSNRLDEKSFQKVEPTTDAESLYFEATGHSVQLGFKDYWEQHGGLAAFGYPLSQEFEEDGKIVQYFERVRLEYHASNPELYKILVGRLGAERLSEGANRS